MPSAAASASATARGTSGCASAFVSTTSGLAPLSHATSRKRSRRRAENEWSSAFATTTMSTFAATTGEECDSAGVRRSSSDAALEHGADAALVVHGEPVADGECDAEPSVATRSAAVGGAHGGVAAVDAHDARGRGEVEAELCELGSYGARPSRAGQAPRSDRSTRFSNGER